MADENGSEYIVQQGDTLSSIAKKYFIPDWEIIYCHDKNAQFRSNNPDYNKIRIGDKLFIPNVFSLVVTSEPSYVAVMPGNSLFFDTHMHIQSNNCVPLTLQWGLTKRNASVRLEGARGPLTVVSGAYLGRFGQIGGYSSDEIAIIYNGTGQRSIKRDGVFWKIFDYTAGLPISASQCFSEYLQKIFQTEKGLEILAQKSEDEEPVFESATHYYFKNNCIERIATCHLMDMSYSHFWGNYGLPVNLPLGNSNVFINDFVAAGLTNDILSRSCGAAFTSMTEKTVLLEAAPGWSHLFARKLPGDTFSFKSQYNNYIQPKISMPDGVKPTNESYILFSTDPNLKALNTQLIQKDYIHIIEDLPKSETKLFEDYKSQKLRSIKAAMTYPLKIFPFFHYDPRRHVPKSERSALLGELINKHAFYRLSKSSPYLKLTPDEVLNTTVYISSVLDKLSENESAYKELFSYPTSTDGVFWGVKMYPRLGFAPDNFEQFPQLDGIYTVCQDNKIPITAHCSRGPMCIADYVNYSRYGDKRCNPPPSKSQDPIDYKQHEFWFADNFASSANWENVLKKYPELKIDLAHFGGMDIWLLMGSLENFDGTFEKIEASYAVNPKKIPVEEELYGTNDEKKDQLASLYYTWVKNTAELCNKYKNVYTDLACFAVQDKSETGENNISKMELMAKNLAFLINKYPKLKEKILVGSDWYMAELGGTKGVGTYFTRMFEMLRMVSDLAEPKFDAWHQFAVINPLKFMGLWVDGGKIDVEKCKRYVERLTKWVTNEELKIVVNKLLPSKTTITDAGNSFINYLKNIPEIKDSKEMKDEKNKLLILGN